MRKSHCCRKEIVAQVGQMAEAYIELAAVPAPDKANDMPFPSPIRRSTKALNKVGTCSCWNFLQIAQNHLLCISPLICICMQHSNCQYAAHRFLW